VVAFLIFAPALTVASLGLVLSRRPATATTHPKLAVVIVIVVVVVK
jgi:hypothetical protein